jgi:hypothetical protein
MAALCYDPIGQGERSQVLDASGQPKFSSVLEHTLVGVDCILLGTNTARYRIWDGMRGLDYLLSRDDIDPNRIGCTGNSGGGTLTSYIMALDQRVYCAAPSCYLTSLVSLIDGIGPQDAEQNIYSQVAHGMEHADYIMMRAPLPTLICAATKDFFDIKATWHTFRRAKRFYNRMGFAERVDLIETDAKHGFSTRLRIGAVRWMRRWLLNIDDAVTEPNFPVMSKEDLQCASRGQVLLMPNSRSVFDLNVELEEMLANQRRKFWDTTPKAEALQKVREITGIRKLEQLPLSKVEKVGTVQYESYSIDKIVLQTEKGIYLPALIFKPSKPVQEAYLYLHGQGKHIDAGANGPIQKLVLGGNLVLAVDLRGIGETEGTTTHKAFIPLFGPDWQDFFRAYLLGKSYLGMRTEDILVCTRFLSDYYGDQETCRVHLIGIGEAGPPVLHAAAMEPDLFASIRLERSLVSWSNVVRTPVTINQLINVIHGALRIYDLPDLQASIPAEKIIVVEPKKADGTPVG